tara:strand:- start:2905 stop:3297 length:393 start_codon:yes stop_codon:yes gene_type:complete
MKIVILGKRDQMGTNPVIRVKGMSRLQYIFTWDPEIRHYAYEPKEQREIDDIFRTQNRLYKTMFFSAWLGAGEVEAKEPDMAELDGLEEEEDKPELLKRCRKLEIPVIPQDRPSSLKRLLGAFKLGYERS